MKNERLLAAQILLACEKGIYSNIALDTFYSREHPTREQRGRCTALVMGTLSRQITLDFYISTFLNKPIEKLDREVRVLLRMGTYERLWMDSAADYAVVNETVELCRPLKKSSATGLVNAVLRKVSLADLEEKVAAIEDLTTRLSVIGSVHPNLAGLLLEEYGYERAKEFLEITFLPPQTFVHYDGPKEEEQAWYKRMQDREIGLQETSLPRCYQVTSNVSSLLRYTEEGTHHIQGLPAQYTAHVVQAKEGMRVMDTCAAPGGKTLCLAREVGERGYVLALDVNARRVQMLQQAVQQAGFHNVEVLEDDARSFRSNEPFDAVLCDVPCSGFGEIASKPEIRLHDPLDSQELSETQAAILENASTMVNVGGTLVYSTCTILQRENEAICNQFLTKHPEYAPKPIEWAPEGTVHEENHVKFLPHEGLREGFYVAAFQKMW